MRKNLERGAQPTRRRRVVKTLLWTVGCLFLAVVVLWLSAAAYIEANREKVLKQVVEQLNESLGGRLEIEHMEPTLVADFPNVSVLLRNVHLRDSLWSTHRRDLFSARTVFVRVSPASALWGDGITIRQLRVRNASVFLFVDALGYSNGYLLRSPRDTLGSRRRQGPSVRKALLEDVRVVIQHVPRQKLFRFHVRSMDIGARDRGAREEVRAEMDVFIGGLGFNLSRGTFAQNKRLRASLDAVWDKTGRQIILPRQPVRLNDERVMLGLTFDLTRDKQRYDLQLEAPSIRLDTAATFLAENISRKLGVVQLARPARAEARISGSVRERNPKVLVKFIATDNVLTTLGGALTDCSFSGFFNNEVVRGQPRTDPNSVIEVDSLSGVYKGIRIRADTVAIHNLISPKLTALIRSDFEAEKLNAATGGRPFRFSAGRVAMRVRYHGSLSLTDTVVPDLRGTVRLADGAAVYTPRDLAIRGMTAHLVFEGTTVRFPTVALAVGNSSLQMSGVARDLLTALHRPNHPAGLEWNVQSPNIALADFLPFIRQRSSGGRGGGSSGEASPLADRLDEILDAADAHFRLQVRNLQYRRLQAADVRADVVLTRTRARVVSASLRVGGGSVQVRGEADQSGAFDADVGVEQLSLPVILQILNNFGQDVITPANVRGNASLDAHIAGRLDAEGNLQRRGLAGNLSLRLTDGALIGFGPLVRIGKYVFRKRNLENIRLEPLSARFRLREGFIDVEPMQVRSSALTVNLHGVYALQAGTDLHVQLPLRNPEKDSADIAEGVISERGEKGITIHLRARNPTGEELDIDWDRGGKAYKAALEARNWGNKKAAP